jgi:hypothetical protein
MKRLITLLLASLSACAAAPTADTSIWNDKQFPIFAEYINKLSGEDSINCGFYDMRSWEIKRSRYKSAPACVRQATKEGKPFRFGEVRIIQDSYIYTTLTLSPDGEYWLITLDLLLDDSDAQAHIDRCKTIIVKYSNMAFQGGECIEVSVADFVDGI